MHSQTQLWYMLHMLHCANVLHVTATCQKHACAQVRNCCNKPKVCLSHQGIVSVMGMLIQLCCISASCATASARPRLAADTNQMSGLTKLF